MIKQPEELRGADLKTRLQEYRKDIQLAQDESTGVRDFSSDAIYAVALERLRAYCPEAFEK